MLTQSLIKLYNRDLNKLQEELKLYTDETQLWVLDTGISNSAGNLCLHLIGNLNHFIGSELGKTGYIRQRDLEFSSKNTPLKILLQEIDKTKEMVETTLNSLTEVDLQKEYKRNPLEGSMTIEYFLLYLNMHLAYHLGQINYHRRLLN